MLFAGDQADVEMNAQGQIRGFCIVTFSEDIQSIQFIENKICEYEFISYNVDGKGSALVQQDLQNVLNNSDPKGKIIILKKEGVLEIEKHQILITLNSKIFYLN